MAEHFNDKIIFNYRNGVRKQPFYSNEADYNTNAPSYYDYLSRYNGFISNLIDFVNGLSDEIDFMKQNYEALTLRNEDVTYTVGKDGDFDTLNHAFEHIANLYVQPKNIKVLILKDYIIREQLFLRERDYRHVQISSENDVVQVDDTYCDNYIIPNSSEEKYKPIFYGVNSYYPEIDFKLQSVNTEDTLSTGFLMDNSTLKFTKDSGSVRFNYVGLFAYNNSNVFANDCDFSYNGIVEQKYGSGIKIQRSNLVALRSVVKQCGEYGYWVQSASNINISNSLATGCGHHNLVVSQGSTGTARNSTFTDCLDNAVVVTTNSSLDLSNSDCSRCGNNNVVVQLNSTCYFENGISNNSGISGLNVTKHSFVDAPNVVLKNNERNGLDCKDGSNANIKGSTVTGNKSRGIYCLDNSSVNARSCEISNNGSSGIHCYSAYVNANLSKIKNNNTSGIRSFDGGRVMAEESDIQNNGEYGLHASRGVIFANKGICKNNQNISSWDISASWGGEITCMEVEVSPTGETFRCSSSSIIKASDVKGSAKANKTPQEINDQGVIFSNNITVS